MSASNQVGDLKWENGSPEDRSLEAFEAEQALLDVRRLAEVEELSKGIHPGLSLALLRWPLGATLLAVGAVTIGLVTYHYHDIMVQPEYWWECLVLQCAIWMSMCAFLFATTTRSVLNMDSVYTLWKSWLITYIAGYVFGYTLSWASLSALWVYGLNLRYPIPIGGIWNQFLGLTFMIISIWFQLPAAWRKIPSFRLRAKWVIIFHLYGVFISAFYWILWIAMAYTPPDYQPILAVVIPACREALFEVMKIIGT
jgi:hypothetical protein